MNLSIIIVNWNVKELLDSCLSSIKKYTTGIEYEIIVVDSASHDGSAAIVARKYPEVRLIACKENVGFTKGNNLGLKEATGRQILYLNPDIELIENAILPMYRYLEDHTEVGVIGCRLLNSDRSLQSSIGTFLSLSSLWREYYLRKKESNQIHPNVPTEVEVVLGACLLVRGEAVRKLGGFDQRYFMYQEETDLCLTLKEQGLQTVYFPEVAMIHHGSKSSSKSEESRERSKHENRKSQYLFMRKHYRWATAQLAKLMIILALLVRLPFLILLGRKIKAHYYQLTGIWLLKQW